MPLEPTTPQEVVDAVRATPRLLPVGARTKPRLSALPEGFAPLSLRRVSGIIEYDPGEFTFTALAGTPVREIAAALAAQGQYLPFDPVFAESGATLGGTIASGLQGPGRLRYGGIRDFILAVQYVDGAGHLLRGGAKVVKNAAGFDFPKFFVGSLGRCGVIVEATFKVFPRPAGYQTIRIPVLPAALPERIAELASGRWEFDALDFHPETNLLYARLGGPEPALAAITAELLARWPDARALPEPEAHALWTSATEFQWAADCALLFKIPLTLRSVPELLSRTAECPDARIRIGAAGNVAWIALPERPTVCQIDPLLRSMHLTGLVIRGPSMPLFIGHRETPELLRRIQRTFDPCDRFPADHLSTFT